MDKRIHPTFLQERRPLNSQELSQYNPYIHGGQDLRNLKLRSYFGRTKIAFGENDPRHHKKTRGNTIIR